MSPDGVFYETASGRVGFRGIAPPRDQDVEAILARVTERIERLLERRTQAVDNSDETPGPARQLLLQCASAAPSDRITIEGSSKPRRRDVKRGRAGRRKHLCVRHPKGLELHAAVRAQATDTRGLENLCA